MSGVSRAYDSSRCLFLTMMALDGKGKDGGGVMVCVVGGCFFLFYLVLFVVVCCFRFIVCSNVSFLSFDFHCFS